MLFALEKNFLHLALVNLKIFDTLLAGNEQSFDFVSILYRVTWLVEN